MGPWQLAELAPILGARLEGDGGVAPSGPSLDTRTLPPGACFVALRGERDGHRFAPQAVAGGASCLLVDHRLDLPVPQLVVADTLAALQRWGQARLAAFRPPWVFGITGSVGKTTTKELLAAATGAWKTPGNRNNTLGIPEALATLSGSPAAVVLEMGMSTPGEITRLVEIAPLDAGLVTGIGTAHLENFPEGREGLARAKGELVAGLRAGGYWCHPAEDPWCRWIAQQPWASRARAVPVGPAGPYGWEGVQSLGVQGERFVLKTPRGRAEVRLRLRGMHHVSNAALAAACALEAGWDPEAVLGGLAAVVPEAGRGRLHPLRGGGWLLDESYNASPDAILACGRALLDLAGGEALAVLGSMRELGSDSADLHRATGEGLRALGFQGIFAYGEFAGEYAAGFGAGAVAFPDFETLRDASTGLGAVPGGARVLVKGSRHWRAERAVAWLLAALGADDVNPSAEG